MDERRIPVMERPLAVLGAGNGGQCAAADLALAGFSVNLFQLPQFQQEFEPIQRTQEISLRGVGREGRAKLSKATCEITEAIDGVDIILVVVPAFGHEPLARLCAPHLRDGQIVVLLPGTGGTLEWHRVLHESGVTAEVVLAETSTLPYGTRVQEPGSVELFVEAEALPTGVFPGRHTDQVIAKLQKLYPAIVPCQDVLEAAVNNPNPIVHPAATLLNAGRIEYSGGDFWLYKEGMTPAVARVFESLNDERLAICDGFGWQLRHCCGLPFRGYGLGDNVEECRDRILDTSMGAAFGEEAIEPGIKMKGPESMQDRFITEDVPYGLVLFSGLGDLIGAETPIFKAIIALCSAINRTDYGEEGRGLGELGLEHMSAEKLLIFLREGDR
jgi:opine dehydrogenase